MARIILHIGHRKTGTTSIQHVFSGNADALRELGVLYPKAGRGKPGLHAHHNLAYELCESLRSLGRFDVARGGWAACLAEIDAASCRSAVISSEAFTMLTGREVANLAGVFRDRELHVVLYLRRQDKWLQSELNQRARFARAALDPVAYIERALHSSITFGSQVDDWTGVFGVENLTVAPIAEGGNIVLEFSGRCGIDPANLVGWSERRNERVPLKLLVAAGCVVEECSKSLGVDYTLSRHTGYRLSEFFRPREDWVPRYSLFSFKHAERIAAHYAEENERLAARLGWSFPSPYAEEYADYVAALCASPPSSTMKRSASCSICARY